MQQNIVLLGSGNLASNIAPALCNAGWNIVQVYSQRLENAKSLASKLGIASYTNETKKIKKADIYISALKDSVSQEVWSKTDLHQSLVIHTSGSLPANALSPFSCNFGVLYPLMTLSKQRIIDFDNIPLFTEANSTENEEIINKIAHSISKEVHHATSEQRSQIHLAAVWANNFSNYMYSVAEHIMRKNGLPFECLLPLIDETAKKIHSLSPHEAQTGPAVRYDTNIINRHIELQESEMAELYKKISENIHRQHCEE